MLLRYGVAVLSVGLALALTSLLLPLIKPPSFALFFTAVLISAWYGGRGPGLLATALAALSIGYFLIDPSHSFFLGGAGLLHVAVFVSAALLVSSLYTARGRAEAAAQISEQRLSTMLRSIGDAVIATDAAGRVTFMNHVAQELTGWKEEEATGKDLKEVFRIINEQTRQAVENPVSKVLREGIVVGLANHTALVARDGTEKPIDDSGAPIKDPSGRINGVVLIFRDVTERQRFERARLQLAAIIESSDDAIIGKTLEGTITSWNESARRMYGYSAEEVVGRHISIIVPPERSEELSKIMERIRNGERVDHLETVRVRKDGKQLNVSVTISPIKDAEGRIIGASAIARDITERKRVEAELRRSRHQIEIILRGVAESITAQDSSGRLIYANEAAVRALGYASDKALLETPVQELMRKYEIMDESGRPFPRELLPGRLALKEGRSASATMRFRSVETGAERWSTVSATPVFDEQGRVQFAINIFHDITERKRAEEAQRFIVEASSVLASSLDYETTLRSVARMAVPTLADWCAIDVLEEDQSIKRLAVAHVDQSKVEWAHELQQRYPPDPDAPHGVPQVLRTGRSEIYPEIPDSLLEAAAQDEEHLQIMREIGFTSAMIVPLTAHGRTLGAISFISAESGRHYKAEDLALAEDLARRAGLAMDNARLYRSAQEANRIKDEFLATLSHELRTPLTSILGWAAMLRTNTFDQQATARALETIERNAKAQTQIVEDLLDVSRIITGKLRLEIRPIDLAPVIEMAIDSVRPTADVKGIRIKKVLDPGAGAVSGDPARLQQVMWNLLSNAVKFTPQGGLVEVRLQRVNFHAQITVSDTGQGISPEFLPHVFDRFRQADGTITRAHGGLGLGLAIVRHLVELHGGSVRAQSTGAGQGAAFIVDLPLVAVHEAGRELPQVARAVQPGSAETVRPPSLENLHVLVVDDELDARELLTLILATYGAKVTAVASVAEALDALERLKPDVLVSDIGLPSEDGYLLMRKVRALDPERGGRIPAVALTAYAREDDRMRALLAGYHVHLAKPINPAELIAVIGSLAGLTGRARE
ncbi:MAG TPA: PAS domain S-box protein [Pyrinomonadaceae bacterium]|nr:PAS domain S-box protein [Pyrinomonadaceae bacterium]